MLPPLRLTCLARIARTKLPPVFPQSYCKHLAPPARAADLVASRHADLGGDDCVAESPVDKRQVSPLG